MSTSSQTSSEGDSKLAPHAGESLKGYQRKFLRAMAHAMKPVLLVGQRGVTPTVAQELAQALDRHELVKIKFIECKVKSDKQRMAEELKAAVGAHLIGMLGHTAIFFRSNPDPEKRKISPPQRSAGDSEVDSIPV
jgi:RNA-binding protein